MVDEKLWGEDEERPQDRDAKTEKDAPIKVRSGATLRRFCGQLTPGGRLDSADPSSRNNSLISRNSMTPLQPFY